MIEALNRLYGDVWAILPEAHRQLAELSARAQIQGKPPQDEAAEGSLVTDGIQHIHVEGVIVPDCPLWAEKLFGLCSIARVRTQLETAAIRPDVDGVLMIYDTPGGYLPGVPGVAKMLRDFEKPVVGYVSGMCASAGYWLACSQTLYAPEEAAVGSIGVYLTVRDYSRMFELQGLRSILISTGEHKGAGEIGTQITEAHIEHLRDEVIKPMGEMFFGFVQANRDLDEALLDGRTWRGNKAAALGLIDATGDLSDAFLELETLTERPSL